MSDTNEVLRRVVAQSSAGTDVLLGGTPIQARQLMAEAAAALADRATVVSVAAPIGELSLSTLIAQLSGRPDLDDQDDSVLELCFKRLKGDGQTVLMVLAPAGISRSALRYLQHVSRQSPRLALVMFRSASLDAMLDEPGFAALRARLHASPVIGFDALAEAISSQAVAVALPIAPSVPTPPAPVAATTARRPMLWAASALGAAAMAGIIWLGHNAPGTAVAGSKLAQSDIPLRAATVSLPVAAELSLPLTAAAPSPALAGAAPTPTANPPPIALATLPAQPPSMTSARPDTIVAGLIQPPVRADHAPQIRRPDAARRELTRFARARPFWPSPREQEPAEYQPPTWDGVSPIWMRRDPRRRDSPYLGTYAVGPNGVRVFEYDP